jgi:hypothetical protein
VTIFRHDPQVDLIATFRRRCAVAVVDWMAGKLDLHEAVDELAALARDRGINTDIAQTIMADAFRPHRRPGDGGTP